MNIKRMKLAELAPADYNPRKDLKPGDQKWKEIEKSLTDFGMVEPIVWNCRTKRVVGGHQRLKILLARGVEEEDVSVVDLEPGREMALNVALNKVGGDWDSQLLPDVLAELESLGLLEATGCYSHSASRTSPTCLSESRSWRPR